MVDFTAAPKRPCGNLPSELTSFIGRERETVEVMRSLGDFRLLTLTGPGGCGKTRLAGAAEALREQTSTPIPPCESAVHDDNVSALSTAIGEKALALSRTLKPAQLVA